MAAGELNWERRHPLPTEADVSAPMPAVDTDRDDQQGPSSTALVRKVVSPDYCVFTQFILICGQPSNSASRHFHLYEPALDRVIFASPGVFMMAYAACSHAAMNTRESFNEARCSGVSISPGVARLVGLPDPSLRGRALLTDCSSSFFSLRLRTSLASGLSSCCATVRRGPPVFRALAPLCFSPLWSVLGSPLKPNAYARALLSRLKRGSIPSLLPSILAATYSPTTGPCLKPWPEPPPTSQTLSNCG